MTGMPPNLVVSSGFLPTIRRSPPAESQPHSVDLPYPAIEELPEFAGRIDSSRLQPACRHFNGSIARFGGHIFLVYRLETFNAVSKLGIAELNSEFAVVADKELELPEEEGVHYEDPRLTVMGNQLVLQFAHVKFGLPVVCRQRMVIIGNFPECAMQGIRPFEEIPLPFGNIHGIEKNWSPFVLENGAAALVYQQRPRLIIEVVSRAGHASTKVMRTPPSSSLSGRCPPLKISDEHYLEFVGGHIPCHRRATRYWFGAQLFTAAAPYAVVKATKAPLVWGTEASPTLLSPRPHAGHPACIFPSGIMREGEYVIVSCGVNDSYIALLRYHIPTLLAQMEDVS